MKLISSSLLAGTATLILTGAAMAADPIMPTPVIPTVPVATVDNWTGFYAGVNAGYGWGRGYDNNGTIAGPNVPFDAINGLFGGIQIGGNVQNDAIVFGLEADIQASGMSQTDGPVGQQVVVGVDYFGTIRGRVGVDIDGVMPFLTAGLAYGQGRVNTVDFGGANEAQFHVGWTAGAGVEFKLDDSISLKGEYMYADLGQRDYPLAAPGLAGGAGVSFHAVRIGANFHF